MKEIRIKQLTLRNWRGEKERTTIFNTDGPTFICGANGLGKSRHFDAFCWLLFGKDSQDRKDFEIRTHDADGNILHRCECSVEAVILIDGTENTLKREYKEQWTKPRGQVEEVFSGNVTECTWNGTPVKVGEFSKRVQEEIIDDTLFKMLTNPRYFTEKMKWQQQRECLLQMAGTATDQEIAADNSDFKALLDTLGGKSLNDYRKEVAAEKKRLKAKLSEIQPRIDQTQRMMPEADDWTYIENAIHDIDSTIASLTQQTIDYNARNEAFDQERKQVSKQIYELKNKRQELENAQLDTMRRQADAKNQERRAIEQQLKAIHADRSQINIDIHRTDERITYLTTQVASLTSQLDALRQQWKDINARTYNGSDVCPHCGQPLPDEMILQAVSLFDKKKQEDIEVNTTQGKSLAAQLNDYKIELQQKQTEKDALAATLESKEAEIKQLYDELETHPNATADYKDVTPTDEMLNIDKQIESLTAQQHQADNKNDEQFLRDIETKRDQMAQSRTQLIARLQKRQQIDAANQEIQRLTDEGRNLAQQIADVEKREYTAAQFSKKKIESCEQRINGMFTNVRFQLFDYTQEGNEFEVCIPLVDGTPYAVVNTAKQVNAGLDIINTLCQFNNLTVPIFCDGAESVNHYINTSSQMIFLHVTEDRELVII